MDFLRGAFKAGVSSSEHKSITSTGDDDTLADFFVFFCGGARTSLSEPDVISKDPRCLTTGIIVQDRCDK